ncbi:N-acyl amino acid synthase FeeM domain-containing protein [Ideonella sp. A 288]|uniref:N-acyl amino acid synthase FeeM domain-containing protein n=1 Tax=Ideonella sp. A 288 TaxID=1962181 RepID=UPI0018FECB3E|nr:hypothetical protein [Ideonella sp. A 288]
MFRSLVACDPSPDPRLELKIAETRDELEACFRLLHDAYVAAGFMVPDPSGMRVTPYHALPTTTTLCAKFEGRVVGTMTLIRDGVFGFPMQSAFDLTSVRAKRGQIAEVSALAIHPDFRTTGGWILFPLMKFMYEYCTRYFDTRHLVIAVNPDKIELYESILFFERLEAAVVDHYDFANGAPAVGATLDLHRAQQVFRQVYGRKSMRRNLYRYFVDVTLANIRAPVRPYHTTNDPVLTPALIDHFFNHCTSVFAQLDDRRRMLLRSIYDAGVYQSVLPTVKTPAAVAWRRHPRYSVRCPAEFTPMAGRQPPSVGLNVIEMSRRGFRAECASELQLGMAGHLHIELGTGRHGFVDCEAVHQIGRDRVREYGFKVVRQDEAWLECVVALEKGQTHSDLLQPRSTRMHDRPSAGSPQHDESDQAETQVPAVA